MARESNSPGAKQASLLSNLTSLLRWEYRAQTGGPKQTALYDRPVHTYLRLVRSGNTVSGYSSNTGNTYQLVNSVQIGDSECLQVGITAFSNNPSGQTAAVFSGVLYDGANSCAAGPLTLNDSPLAGGLYRSAATITSAGSVAPSTEVVFEAGQSITLTPGFTAGPGATFTARIQDCTPIGANTLAEVPEEAEDELPEGGSPALGQRPEIGQMAGADQLSVFPNPFRNQATVALNLAEDKQVGMRLFDLTGKLVSNVLAPALRPAGTNEFTVDGSRLAPGVYILAVQIGEAVQQRRLVVMR